MAVNKNSVALAIIRLGGRCAVICRDKVAKLVTIILMAGEEARVVENIVGPVWNPPDRFLDPDQYVGGIEDLRFLAYTQWLTIAFYTTQKDILAESILGFHGDGSIMTIMTGSMYSGEFLKGRAHMSLLAVHIRPEGAGE